MKVLAGHALRSMRRWMLVPAGLAMFAVALSQDGGDGAAQGAFEQLDTVVIVGERTPPLWKLTKKGHVVWILGSFRPQPRGLQFNSRRLDQLIAGSQEVIFPGPAYVASPGFSAMPAVLKSDRNPGGATLQSLMPAESYAKWLALRQKYSSGASAPQPGPGFTWGGSDARWVVLTEPYRGGDGIDSMRPTLAWEALRRAAMDRHGLVSYDLEAAVTTIAKMHAVPVRKLHNGRELIIVWSADPIVDSLDAKHANAAEILGRTDYGDLECLRANLDLLEPVLAMRKVQASAWARGDLEAFRSADTGLRLRDCMTDLVGAVSGGRLPGSVDAQKALDRYYRANRDSAREVQKYWVSAVQAAVKKNKVTFSMVPVDQLLAEDGYLAALRDKDFVLAEQ